MKTWHLLEAAGYHGEPSGHRWRIPSGCSQKLSGLEAPTSLFCVFMSNILENGPGNASCGAALLGGHVSILLESAARRCECQEPQYIGSRQNKACVGVNLTHSTTSALTTVKLHDPPGPSIIQVGSPFQEFNKQTESHTCSLWQNKSALHELKSFVTSTPIRCPAHRRRRAKRACALQRCVVVPTNIFRVLP